MAGIGNTKEATFSDGSGSGGDVLNIDTVNGIVQIPNGKKLVFYSDAYTTISGQIANGTLIPGVSATSPALATSGTITTANVGVARVNPGSAVTAVVLGSGTTNGQEIWVVNEAAVANSIQFAASGSSFVADGTNDIIPGLSARLYVWDNSQSAWFATPQTTGGTQYVNQSSSAAALATSGTVTTANVGIARLNPGSAVTACVLGTGTFAGQQVTIINEAAVTNTITMAASATSNVADGTNCLIPGLQARMFIWDSAQSLWFEEPINTNGTTIVTQSGSAAAIAASGTITTANVGVARLNPGSAVNAIVMGTGTLPGQQCWVINEAGFGSYVQMAASATSNVADGINCFVPGGTGKLFIWDSAQSLWFDTSQTANGTVDLGMSSSAAAIATSGTVTTAGVGLARLNPGSAVTACVLASGNFPGQMVVVSNEAAPSNTVQFAASGSSLVADGTNSIIPGLQTKIYVWNTTNWYEVTNLVGGALAPIVSSSAAAIAISGTVTTAGVGIAKVNPGSAVTSCVLGSGTFPGQKITVMNVNATGANSVAFAASGSSFVADGNTTAISGLRCAEYTWDATTSLWYKTY